MSSAAHHKGAASGAEIEGWLSRIENISGVVSKYLTEDPDVEADEREKRRIKVEKDENEAFQLKMKDRYDPARYKRFENEEFIDKLIKEVDAAPVVKTTDLRLLSDFEKLAVKEAEACKARGNAALVGGNLEEARNQYEMGIGMDPQSVDLVVALNNNLAQVALRQLNYEDCVRRASVVLAIERLNVKALFRRASAFSSLYKLREAKTDVDLLLSADSKNNEAKKLRTEVEDDLVDLDMFAGVEGGTSQLQLLVNDLQAQMLLEDHSEETTLKIAEHLVFADRAVDSIAGAIGFHVSGGVQLCIQLLYSAFNNSNKEGDQSMEGSVASKGLSVLVLRVLSKCLPTRGSSRRTLQLLQRRDEEENTNTTTPSTPKTNLHHLLTYLVDVVNTGTLPVGIPAGRLLGAVLEGGHKVGMVLDVQHTNHKLQMSALASHIDAVSKKGKSAAEWEVNFADALLVIIRALLRRDPTCIPESTLQAVVIPFCRNKVNSTSTTGLADVLEMLLAVPRGGYPSMESHKDILVGLHKKLFKRGGTNGGALLVEGCASITFNALVQYPVVAAVEGASSTRAELVDFLVKAGVFNDYLAYIKKQPTPFMNNNNMASIVRVVGVVAKGITVSEPLCQIVQGDDVIRVTGWGMLATPPLLEHATTILCHIYWRAKLRNVEVDAGAATGIITMPLLQQLFDVCSIPAVSPAEIVSIANASLLLGNFPLHLKVGGEGGVKTVESWLKSIGGMKTTIEALRDVRNHAEQAERSKIPALVAQLRSAQKNIASLIGKWASGSEELKEALRVSNGFEVLMCSLKETKTVA